jgi:hypothetical protein
LGKTFTQNYTFVIEFNRNATFNKKVM